MRLRWWLLPLFLLISLLAACGLLLGYAVVVAYPGLPSLEVLTDYRPKIPLQVFSSEGALIGEFGEERRALVAIKDVPKPMVQAIIAAEDERFYEHGGVDYIGVARAALSNFLHGGARQGASTITMQVARNFFLSTEKTFTRKFNETLLAFKIEHNLSKDEILQLYVNQIYLGQRAYGFAAAARTYFGRPLDQLSIAEFAMLAGLPKAPSSYNPVSNPKRAKIRQEYVLRRMRELGFISDAQFETAVVATMDVRKDRQSFATRADHMTEMVRQHLFDKYQEAAYTSGFRVYTTLSTTHQDAAIAAVRNGVLDYDKRHGFRGAEGYVDVAAGCDRRHAGRSLRGGRRNRRHLPCDRARYRWPRCDALRERHRGSVGRRRRAALRPEDDRREGRLPTADCGAARAPMSGGKPQGSGRFFSCRRSKAALVSVDSSTGAIRALVGGFDFNRNKYNRVTQAYRQPGSSFKPFVYSAALEKGFTPATVISDSPLSFDASETGSTTWEPKNYDGTFDGPITMRTALTKSKNMVSIRILQAISPQYAQDYVVRFGFERKLIPAYLTMALGAGGVTVQQMAGGYATFANGGFRVAPYFIDRITDAKGSVIEKSKVLRPRPTRRQGSSMPAMHSS